jgi:tetratricopeptide (TPR) repeat protein
LLLGLLSGCTTPQVAELLDKPVRDLPRRIELAEVPFFPQEEYQCGPASLAAVFAHAGVTATPESLVAQVYLPGRQGSLQAEMMGATRRHGLVAYELAPRLEDVLRELASGTPVLVLENLVFDWYPVWHYAVAVGYDLEREEIAFRSGTTQRLVTTLSNFERIWGRSHFWAMLALPPDRLPATADEQKYVSSVVTLERVVPKAARRAYATALGRWPDNLVARMGLGNSAYALRDLPGAESAYRRATQDHPAAGDAWNNLAQTLFEQGRRPEAQAAAERAVALGGPRLPQYRATLRAILEAR